MKIKYDTKTQERRDTWKRSPSASQSSRLRITRPPTTPPLPFAELLTRLSRGRLGSEVARELLLIDAKCISLSIEIDRDTGLVSHWKMRTHGGSARDATIVTGKMAPAA